MASAGERRDRERARERAGRGAEEPSAPRRAAGAAALVLGGALVQTAAAAPLVWQMAAASRAEIGGETGVEWLGRVTAAAVALGVILGARLAGAGRPTAALVAGAAGLGLGSALAAAWSGSPAVVLSALGGLASAGAGCLLGAGVVRTLLLAGRMPGLTLGVTLGVGLLAANRIFSSASFVSLSRGVPYLLGHLAWSGLAAGLAGALLLALAARLGGPGRGQEAGRLPLVGPRPVGAGALASSSLAFFVLLGLALVSAFAGLAVQRGVAALAVIGLPESSFGSGVMAGMALARLRPLGPVVGGLVHDLLGPRAAVGLAGLAIALGLLAMSRYAGPDGPWNELAGAMGLATGLGLAIVPAAALFLLGREHLGAHFGLLYLGFALGEVAMAPLVPVLVASPVAVLAAVAGLAVVVAALGFRLRPVRD